MLSSLYLRNFVIVAEAEINLGPGMTALTGETGAGKSILVDALMLALGERAMDRVVRHGSDEAEIIASFTLDDAAIAIQWLVDNDLASDRECVLRRIVRRDGPSRGYINGRPVTMQQLRAIGEHLVDIHGQHEHQSLLRRDAQRAVLDGHADNQVLLARLAEQYDRLTDLEQELERLRLRDADGVSRLDLLRHQVGELERLAPGEDENRQLEEEHRRLANASDLINGIGECIGLLEELDDVAASRQLGRTIQRLHELAGLDPEVAEIGQVVETARVHVDEAVSALRHYLDRLEVDPERLDFVDRRLGSLHDLARKYRVTADELPAQLLRFRAELEDLESAGERVTQLIESIATSREECLATAIELSTRRRTAATTLAQSVTALMQDLGMPGSRFAVEITTGTGDDLRRHGLDMIEFVVSANPGQPLQPLRRVASGGELSRIALALQICATESLPVASLVYDEIDVGIGGQVAAIVARLLHRLGRRRQVLCITHLAQVAARADQQLQVSKTLEEPVVASIAALDGSQRIEEIARMMGGVRITEQTRAHARELLEDLTA